MDRLDAALKRWTDLSPARECCRLRFVALLVLCVKGYTPGRKNEDNIEVEQITRAARGNKAIVLRSYIDAAAID
ncbi:hypothetical protein AKJ16_DCAP09231 [Drosera capensis]